MRKTRTAMIFLTVILSLIVASSAKSVSVQALTEANIAIVNPVTGNNNFTFPGDTPIGTTFIANVTASNVSLLAVWQINISWNPSILKINSTSDVTIPPDNVFGSYTDPTDADITNSNLFWVVGIKSTGPDYFNVTHGTLCQINFTTIKNGTGLPVQCYIHVVLQGEHLFYTKLIDPDAILIPYTTTDSLFVIPEFSDIALLTIFLAMTVFAVAFGRKTLIGRRLRHAIC